MSPKNEEESCRGRDSLPSEEVSSMGPCFFCGQIAANICQFCHNIYYCSKVHRHR